MMGISGLSRAKCLFGRRPWQSGSGGPPGRLSAGNLLMAVRCILALALTGGTLNAPAELVTAAIACPYQRCLGIFSPDPADKFVKGRHRRALAQRHVGVALKTPNEADELSVEQRFAWGVAVVPLADDHPASAGKEVGEVQLGGGAIVCAAVEDYDRHRRRR